MGFLVLWGSFVTQKEKIHSIEGGKMVGSIISGIFCIIGGLWLLAIKEAGSESLLGVIANGIGIYCIGKGLYVIVQGVQLSGIKKMIRRDRDKEIWDKFLERIQESEKIGSIVERIYQKYCIAESVRDFKKGSIEELS